MADFAELTLAVVPTEGIIKLVTIRADDLRQYVDKVKFVLDAIQKQCGGKLQPNREVEQRLDEILRWFKPGYSPFGGAIIQIPGRIEGPSGGNPPPPPAQPVQPSAATQQQLFLAQRKIQDVEKVLKEETAQRQAAEQAQRSAQAQYDAAQRQVTRLEGDARHWKDQYEALNRQLQPLQQELRAAQEEAKLQRLRAQAAQDHGPQLTAAQQRIAALTAQNSDQLQQNATLTKNIEQLEREIADLNQQMSTLQARARQADLDDLLGTGAGAQVPIDDYLP